MPLLQQLLGPCIAADLPPGELPSAVAASKGRGGRSGSSSRLQRGGRGIGATAGDRSPSTIATPADGRSRCKEIGGFAKAQEDLRQGQPFLDPGGSE